MPFSDGYELIRYALDADVEDRLFLRWSIWYQSQMGFEEFKSSVGAPRYQVQREADAPGQVALQGACSMPACCSQF